MTQNGFDALSEEVSKAAEKHPNDIEKQIEIALACPCVEDMMNGPCRESFEDSFRCFMKSEHPEVKGYDCLEHFEGFQACLANNPGHIEEFLLRNKENE